jgi:hypothetical protein
MMTKVAKFYRMHLRSTSNAKDTLDLIVLSAKEENYKVIKEYDDDDDDKIIENEKCNENNNHNAKDCNIMNVKQKNLKIRIIECSILEFINR